MKNVELGQEANAIYYDQASEQFKTVTGKVSALMVDPFGRRFVQIRTARKDQNGNHVSINVDLYAVNATSEERQNYMDVINSVREIETGGNEEIMQLQKDITEACNSQINDLYATLTPLVDLSFEEETIIEEAQEQVTDPDTVVSAPVEVLKGENVPVEAPSLEEVASETSVTLEEAHEKLEDLGCTVEECPATVEPPQTLEEAAQGTELAEEVTGNTEAIETNDGQNEAA